MYRLVNILDTQLKTFLKPIKSCIRDDLDMLNHPLKTINKRTLLVYFDLIDLHSYKPYTVGIEAITL